MTKEVTEIEIFTEEQLNILPQEAKDGVVSLTENLPKRELLVLNPLVVQLLKIKELSKIKYVPLPEKPTKEDTAKHKELIAEFKQAKSDIVAFKKMAGEAKKSIKGPLDALGKQVLVVEKSVVDIALEVAETLDKEFKTYLDEEAEKSRIATEKRNAKATEAINALTEQSKAQSDLIKKSALITFLKYEMLENKKTVVKNAIENYSLEALTELLEAIKEDTFEGYTTEQQLDLLDEQELLACKTIFFNTKLDFTTSINARLKILELEKENEKLIEKIEVVTTPVINQGVQGISITEQISSGQDFAPQANIPLAPQKIVEDDSDLASVVTGWLNDDIININSQINHFINKYNDAATPEQIEMVRRVKGGIKLIEKTILYINNQLPKTN